MSVPGGKVPIANIFVVGVVGIGVACAMETPAEATSTEAVVKLRRRRFIMSCSLRISLKAAASLRLVYAVNQYT
jgi:hypothetical protein